jgi:putative tryptophan/tyrosine transport system substrate-binding protein
LITRRSVLLAGGIGLLVAHGYSRGQPATILRRVGWLSLGSEAAVANLDAAFKQGMRELGWREGKNVEYRIVYANGDASRLEALVRELLGQQVEVILVGNGQSARAAQQATKKIPIVMAGLANAVGAGFVASLPKPGGNITGYTSQQVEVLGKLIGFLHEVVPGARRIAILLNENNPPHAAYWASAQGACAALDLVALRVVASTPAQLGAAVEQIVRQRSQAIVVPGDAMYFTERAKLQELMQTTRLPVAHELRDHVLAGGLLSYGYDSAANYRNAAKYVDKILKGAKPADLPVEQATQFDLVINLKTAKALGLTVPQSLLQLANEVIR